MPAAVPPCAAPCAELLHCGKWLGGRTWVFDGDQPVLQLHSTLDPSCFARLKPGYKPQLTFDSHWGIENQGAFRRASKWTEPTVSGEGKSIKATLVRPQHQGPVHHHEHALTVGFDPDRGTYTYDIESELDVLPGEPFHFRYGMDFEHHTPLDPFRWQYLLVRGARGNLHHRPVYPVDPGVMEDLVPAGPAGMVWPAWGGHARCPGGGVLYRRLRHRASSSSAVCAAFYDTGIAFGQETAKPGTKVKVKYRYTGYPAAEAEALVQGVRTSIPVRMLDPNHHYIFADEWPKLTFSKFEPDEQDVDPGPPALHDGPQRPANL